MTADSSESQPATAPKRRKWPWIVILLILLLIFLNYRYQFYPLPQRAATPKAKAPSTGKDSDVSEPAESIPSSPEKVSKPQTATKKSARKAGETEVTRIIDYAKIKKDSPKSTEETEASSRPAVKAKTESSEDQKKSVKEQPQAEGNAVDLQPDEPAPPANEEVTAEPAEKTKTAAAQKGLGPSVTRRKIKPPAEKPVEKHVLAAEAVQEPAQIPDQGVEKDSPPTTGTQKTAAEEEIGEIVRQRKETFGLEQSVDLVVKPDEAIRIGEETVPMDQILAQIQSAGESGDKLAASRPISAQGRTAARKASPAKRGEKPLEAADSSAKELAEAGPVPEVKPASRSEAETSAKEPPRYYGIYVVQPGDNLWNIHFAFLREYFRNRSIPLPPDADEPRRSHSSGVARILKYAEKMVFIFNIKTRQISRDLDFLEPLEKIVIFNLSNLDRVLSPVDAENLNRVHFDGQDLFVREPA